MLRLHVPGPLAEGLSLSLDAGAARHVQVRRLQPGHALVVFDGRGGEWAAEVVAMRRDGVDLLVGVHVPADRELPWRVTLAVGMPANERMDWLVEKAAELGAACIRPLECERSVLRLSGERAARRRAHWQAIAVSAAEQSGRTAVPEVDAVIGCVELLTRKPDDAAPPRAGWMLSPGAPPPARPPANGQELLLLSGPEGGLSPAEDAAARAAGFEPVGLGPRVLRAETAPLVALAWLGTWA